MFNPPANPPAQTLSKQPWLKRHLPKSLFGRALLIIMLPIALMQIIVAYIFFDAHWKTVTESLSNSVAADISVAIDLYNQAPGAERTKRLDLMMRPRMQLSVVFEHDENLPIARRNAFFSNLDKTLRRALANNLKNYFWFDTTRYPNHIDIRVKVDEGVLRFIVPRERVFAPTGFIFLFWLIMATILLSLVSILFILNQARPIVRLAQAAENFGKGRSIGKYKPTGATEVRQAGHAFLEMRERITRHIQQRTALLASVSHDLRTPLTRLKLHLALEDPSEEAKAAGKDIEDMEQMLDGYLNFARGISEEDMRAINFITLLQSIADTFPAPKPQLTTTEDITINVREIAMKRAVTNLIQNGTHYAKTVAISVERVASQLKLYIDDDGPGIGKSNREQVIMPFIRLDAARNQNTKGVGLGLSIASDIIQSHGGTLELNDSPKGGLRCIVTLPL
ncbi:MAG: ATP-binding protein [Robiginitomaculum sp.]